MADLSLPILDLSRLDAGPEAAAAFRDDLRAATHDVGFFYLTGTGISPELEDRLHRAARDFFALPEADKLAIENVKSPHFRGYTRVGGERTQGRVDWREQIDIGPERAAVADGSAPDYARLIGPNLWPAAQPELRVVVSEWHDHLSGVARKLLRAWAVALGADESYFDQHFGEPSTLIKIVRYPGKDDPTPQQGVGAHKDSGVLTLLWVEPGKGGLQVQRDGEWVDAPPVPGAFVVNIGELLEYATQGYLIATNHRVVSPKYPDDRISVPFFFNPALDARLPIIELPADLAAEARGVTQDPANPIHALYGSNALKSRLRAHPDVAAIHHADLVAARAEASAGPAPPPRFDSAEELGLRGRELLVAEDAGILPRRQLRQLRHDVRATRRGSRSGRRSRLRVLRRRGLRGRVDLRLLLSSRILLLVVLALRFLLLVTLNAPADRGRRPRHHSGTSSHTDQAGTTPSS